MSVFLCRTLIDTMSRLFYMLSGDSTLNEALETNRYWILTYFYCVSHLFILRVLAHLLV